MSLPDAAGPEGIASATRHVPEDLALRDIRCCTLEAPPAYEFRLI